jgi:hypothetical protein
MLIATNAKTVVIHRRTARDPLFLDMLAFSSSD